MQDARKSSCTAQNQDCSGSHTSACRPPSTEFGLVNVAHQLALLESHLLRAYPQQLPFLRTYKHEPKDAYFRPKISVGVG